MNTDLKSKGPAGSLTWLEGISGVLLGVGISTPAHAAGDAAVSIAGWSIALVIVLGVAYLLGRRKE